MKVEIWLTSLVVKPVVAVGEDSVRVYMNMSDDFDKLMFLNRDRIPSPLDDHLRLLWAGEVSDRTFEMPNESTVVIRGASPLEALYEDSGRLDTERTENVERRRLQTHTQLGYDID